MKRILKIYFILLSMFSNLALYAQVDTKGTDFWVSFGNINNQSQVHSVILQIRVVADQPTSGTITFMDMEDMEKTIPFYIPAGSVYTHTLTEKQKLAAYNANSGTSNKSVHIQSDKPVTAYALNTQAALADATNILPIKALGTDYYHLGIQGSSSIRTDQYIVIATQDNTEVYENGNQVCSLSEGGVYFTRNNSDMSGFHVTSNKPIAYFSAHSYATIKGGGENFFQQLPPVNTWGKDFLVPVTNREIELIRIVASQDGTTIHHTGGKITPISGGKNSLNLDAGEWVQLEIKLAENGCYIQADKPVQVCSYMVGQNYDGAVNTYGADESLAWIPPIEQTINSALIAPFAVSTLTTHFALIVTPTSTKNNTKVSIQGGEEQALSGGVWYDNPAAGMSFYSVKLENNSTTSYLFSNPAGLLVYAYGFGYHISYYYLAGSATRDLSASFYVNNIHDQDLPSEVFEIHKMDFRAKVNGSMSNNSGHLKWYINGVEETSAQDQLTWSKNLPNGIYQLKMEVLLSDNSTTKIVESTLTIGSPFEIEVCEGTNVTFNSNINNGGSSPSYQWKKNGVNIDGATEASYTYIPQNGDILTCELFSNANCAEPTTITSHKITVTVFDAPTGGSIDASQKICIGTQANALNNLISASGSGFNINYQWQKATNIMGPYTDIQGATDPLILSPTQMGGELTETTYFRRMITTDCGSAYSDTVTITVIDTPSIYPDIRIQACPGEKLTLNSYLNNTEFVSINWNPASPLSPTINNASGETEEMTSGTHIYRYTISNTCHSDIKAQAYIKVIDVYNQPTDSVSICYEIPEAEKVNLNQFFGTEAGGTIHSITPNTNTYFTQITSSIFSGAYYFNAQAAWKDPQFQFSNTTTQTKRFEFEYRPHPTSCLGNKPIKFVLLVTGNLLP